MIRHSSPEKPAHIARLYDVFAVYNASARSMSACPCCVKPVQVQALFSAPLRELSADVLRSYNGKAMTTWGEEDEWKHFLPRLLELAVNDELDVFWLASKFEMAHWPAWHSEEVEAVRALWVFVVEFAIENKPFVLGEWFGMWARLNEELPPLLALVERAEDANFLEAATALASQEDWLCSSPIYERLTRAFLDCGESASWESAQMMEQIEKLREARAANA